MRVLSALLFLALAVPAQELTPEQALERFEAGEPVWKLGWKVDGEGELLISPDPAAGDWTDWSPAFVRGAASLRRDVANLGALGFLNMLLAGPRDLASLGDAEKLLAISGHETTPEALRKLIVTPPAGDNAALVRRAELERLLAIRLVHERGIAAAQGELEAVERDADADPFLRRAAKDVLHTLNGVRMPPSAVPTEALAALPEQVDVLFFVDQARVPPVFFVPRLAREAGQYPILRDIQMAGGSASPAMHTASARLAELPGLLPFEIARRFGNARVDWTVGAMKFGDRRVAFWIEARGRFEHEFIAESLREKGFAVEEQGGRIRVDDLPFSNALRLTGNRLRVHGLEFAADPDPERAVTLRKAGLGDAPVWVHVPAGSRILTEMPLAAAPKSATATASFEDDGVTVTLRVEHESEVHARAVANLIGGLRQRAERVLEDLDPKPELDKLLGILRGAVMETEGDVLTARVRLHGVTPVELLALFRGLYPD